jgi:glycosyltransferase involved in cell wall biosynthesis
VGRALTWAGSLGAAALTAHCVANLRRYRVPEPDPGPVADRVSVLVPARDEQSTIGPCLRRVLDQTGVDDLEVIVLDDESTDRTAEVVGEVAAGDPRVRLITGSRPPPGWLGKPHACDQLGRAASGSVLVFLDADVRLAPHAVAATVGLLRASGLDLVSPYPRQLAKTAAERLVQPLLPWSFLTTLPLRLAERSERPSLSAANGQLLAVDASVLPRGRRARRGARRGDRGCGAAARL